MIKSCLTYVLVEPRLRNSGLLVPLFLSQEEMRFKVIAFILVRKGKQGLGSTVWHMGFRMSWIGRIQS
jgi:hypothetical protein